MLNWVIAFFLLAMLAAFFGFGGVATASADIAVTLFYVFLVIFVISLIYWLITGRRPPVA